MEIRPQPACAAEYWLHYVHYLSTGDHIILNQVLLLIPSSPFPRGSKSLCSLCTMVAALQTTSPAFPSQSLTSRKNRLQRKLFTDSGASFLFVHSLILARKADGHIAQGCVDVCSTAAELTSSSSPRRTEKSHDLTFGRDLSLFVPNTLIITVPSQRTRKVSP